MEPEYASENCPLCGLSNVVIDVTELTGHALMGDKEYRIDYDLAMALNDHRGKVLVITIKELV